MATGTLVGVTGSPYARLRRVKISSQKYFRTLDQETEKKILNQFQAFILRESRRQFTSIKDTAARMRT